MKQECAGILGASGVAERAEVLPGYLMTSHQGCLEAGGASQSRVF